MSEPKIEFMLETDADGKQWKDKIAELAKAKGKGVLFARSHQMFRHLHSYHMEGSPMGSLHETVQYRS